jgi:hypothetical protein
MERLLQNSIRDALMTSPLHREAGNTPGGDNREGVIRVARVVQDPSEVARQCLFLMLDDGPWRDLGFAGRPRYGLLLQAFRPRWRRQLDDLLKREILASLSAAHLAAGITDLDDQAELVSLFAADPMLFEPLGYVSRGEAIADLTCIIDTYLAIPVSQWPALLRIRVQTLNLPDKRLAAKLETGGMRFGKRLITRVRQLQAL